MKKLISILLVLAMVFSLAIVTAVSAYAEPEDIAEAAVLDGAGASEIDPITYVKGSGEDVTVNYTGEKTVELLRFDFGGDKSRNFSITESDMFGGRPAFTTVGGQPVLSSDWLDTLDADSYSIWLKDINSSTNYGKMTLTIVEGEEPVDEPGEEPGEEPVDEPGEEPGEEPVDEPGEEPADEPGEEPVDEPGEEPGEEPSGEPTAEPGEEPSEEPSEEPGEEPSSEPSTNNNQLAVTYVKGSKEDVTVNYTGADTVELLRFDFGGDKSRNYSITEENMFGGRPAFTNVNNKPVLSADWLETLDGGDYSVWLKDINSSVNYGRMTLTIVASVSVKFADDNKSAQITGDYEGLYARIAISLEHNGETGLFITQGAIDDSGKVLIPKFNVPGLTVTGISVALVPSLADILSSTPEVVADAFVTIGEEPGASTEPTDPGASTDPGPGGNTGASGDPYEFDIAELMIVVDEGRNVVAPTTEATEVDLHTDIQEAYLERARGGEYVVPNSIIVDGTTYTINNRADYSLPAPVSLDWEGDGTSYYVELSTDPEFADARTYTATESSLDIYNLYIGTTYYWRYAETQDQLAGSDVYTFATSADGPRCLYIDGMTNVRDIGGYELADGTGRVRQGMIIRSGRLNVSRSNEDKWRFAEDKGGPDYFVLTVTDAGIDTLINELGVKTELDIRSNLNGETGNMDDDRIPGLTYVCCSMEYAGGTGNNIVRKGTVEGQPFDNAASIKDLFELLADESNYPVVFHCNIGTDRTGCIAFLIDALCGVGEPDLLVDYAYSAFGFQTANRGINTLKNEYIATVSAYPGETLAEQTENALVDLCGLSHETLQAVREIMVEYY